MVGIVEDITSRRKEAIAREQMLTMLAHQLRSPVQQSHKRAALLVEELDPANQLIQGKGSKHAVQAASVRGLTRKTKAVAWSIDLLWKLAKSEKLEKLTLDPMAARQLIKMAREAARDVELVHRRPSRLISAESSPLPTFCDVKVVDNLAPDKPQINCNSDLVEQCVGNLIENAFKYSRPGSTVEVIFELAYRSATLKVRNQPLPGLEIDKEVKERCKEKEWRSKGAAATNVDGTGLGLWLADNIMVAHSGRLDVFETDQDGWNEFALIFPLIEN